MHETLVTEWVTGDTSTTRYRRASKYYNHHVFGKPKRKKPSKKEISYSPSSGSPSASKSSSSSPSASASVSPSASTSVPRSASNTAIATTGNPSTSITCESVTTGEFASSFMCSVTPGAVVAATMVSSLGALCRLVTTVSGVAASSGSECTSPSPRMAPFMTPDSRNGSGAGRGSSTIGDSTRRRFRGGGRIIAGRDGRSESSNVDNEQVPERERNNRFGRLSSSARRAARAASASSSTPS